LTAIQKGDGRTFVSVEFRRERQVRNGERVIGCLCPPQEVRIAPHWSVEPNNVCQLQSKVFVGVSTGETGRHPCEGLYVF